MGLCVFLFNCFPMIINLMSYIISKQKKFRKLKFKYNWSENEESLECIYEPMIEAASLVSA